MDYLVLSIDASDHIAVSILGDRIRTFLNLDVPARWLPYNGSYRSEQGSVIVGKDGTCYRVQLMGDLVQEVKSYIDQFPNVKVKDAS